MSEIRLNVLDAGRAIHGTIHGSIGDIAVAGLSAEPETIEELQDAMARFMKPVDGLLPFDMFYGGSNAEPWDAGIVIIDLAARVVAVESTYSTPSCSGVVLYHDGEKATGVWLPYRVPDDWLFVDSTAEYRGIRAGRCADRKEVPALDARPVLYSTVLKFIVSECIAALGSGSDDPIAEIHAKWLMTPHADLRGLSPRETILLKHDFIMADLQSREIQWSFIGEPAPCLTKESAAYRFAGFGTHEVVLYYDLLRHLLSECWKHVTGGRSILESEEVKRLERIKADWMGSPLSDPCGETPAHILECERRRLPLIVSEKEIFDEDCPLCRAMFEKSGPVFRHLDGCNMDHDFPFSFFPTRAEWEAEEESQKLFDEDFNRKWAQRRRKALDDAMSSAGNDALVH